MGVALVVTGLASFAACHSSQLPPITGRDAMMTDDERQVMRAVLDQTLRPRRDGMIQLGRGTTEAPTSRPDPRFLVFDSTIASCEHDPIVDRPTARGCISTSSFDYLDRVPQMSGLLSRTVFLERNAKSLPIAGTIGEDVVYIPSSIVTTPKRFPPWPSV